MSSPSTKLKVRSNIGSMSKSPLSFYTVIALNCLKLLEADLSGPLQDQKAEHFIESSTTSWHFKPRGDPSITGCCEVWLYSWCMVWVLNISKSLLQKICSYHNTSYSALCGKYRLKHKQSQLAQSQCTSSRPKFVKESHVLMQDYNVQDYNPVVVRH